MKVMRLFLNFFKAIIGYLIWRKLLLLYEELKGSYLIVYPDEDLTCIRYMKNSMSDFYTRIGSRRTIYLCLKHKKGTGLPPNNTMYLGRWLMGCFICFYNLSPDYLPIIVASLDKPYGRNLKNYMLDDLSEEKLFKIAVLGLD